MKINGLLSLAFVLPGLICAAQDAPHVATPPDATQSVATAGNAPTPAVAAGNSYVIGPSDVITVTVWKEPTMSGSVLVRLDGKISLALLGDVTAAGKTPLELADEITTRLKKYIQDPNVSVVLTQSNSKKIYLLGEVTRKGPVDMTPGMTLLEAIGNAGGLTDYAQKGKIYILRVEDGKQQRIPVHYKQALKGDSDSNVALKSGDTIVVP
jgi:polysaccharide biosynthesis/export protein